MLLVGASLHAQADSGWRAGAASAVITPERPMRMGGYGGRLAPFEGVAQDLHAKALAFQDEKGARLVIVTLDLVGVLRGLREDVARMAQERFQLPPERLLMNASHTHCGPEYRANRGFPAAEVPRYNALLRERIMDAIGRALADLAPVKVSYASARAGFAMNRRLDYSLPASDPRRKAPNPRGPVDHDVPVLRVDDLKGKLRAVVFGYACHNTTLSGLQLNGDYAGFAQACLEEAHPGATALFMIGCGADQNPHPRRTMVPGQEPLDLARLHGRNLALAVEAALNVAPTPINGALRAAFEKVDLDFTLPTAEQLRQRAQQGIETDKARAKALLAELEQGTILRSYDYPVQVVRFGQALTLVALGSEVVVDYSLRLKREVKDTALWVAGYSNDYFGYMASHRVLQEGGYEGGDANTGIHPGYWAPSVEERIIGKVHELRQKTN